MSSVIVHLHDLPNCRDCFFSPCVTSFSLVRPSLVAALGAAPDVYSVSAGAARVERPCNPLLLPVPPTPLGASQPSGTAEGRGNHASDTWAVICVVPLALSLSNAFPTPFDLPSTRAMLYDGKIHWAFHCYTHTRKRMHSVPPPPLFCLPLQALGRPCSGVALDGLLPPSPNSSLCFSLGTLMCTCFGRRREPSHKGQQIMGHRQPLFVLSSRCSLQRC